MLLYSFADVIISLAPGAWGMSLVGRLFYISLSSLYWHHVAMRKESINFRSWFRTAEISEDDEDQVRIRLFFFLLPFCIRSFSCCLDSS